MAFAFSPRSRVPVLIVGAGPAGLIAALSLAQNGIPLRIIDKSAEFQSGTRGPGVMVSPKHFNSLILSNLRTSASQLGVTRSAWCPPRFAGDRHPSKPSRTLERGSYKDPQIMVYGGGSAHHS